MSKSIVKGSIADVAEKRKQSIAVSFMNAQMIVLLDVSGSMMGCDTTSGRSRHDVAEEELTRLQNENEGKVALICFSDLVLFCPNGLPSRMNGSTNLAEGLRFIKRADGTNIKLVVISDGEPNSEYEALEVASTFKSKIHTIHIGSEYDKSGRDFLQLLASKTGGTALKSKEIGKLKAEVEEILLLKG